jgi:hypothetical protein
MLRSFLISCFILALSSFITSQTTITGTVIDEISGQPLAGITVRSDYPDQTTTDDEGKFSIKHASVGDIVLYFEQNGESIEYRQQVTSSEMVDLGNITVNMSPVPETEVELPTITLDEGDDKEDANISGLLQAGSDLFARMTNYTFSPARFKRRGLEAEYSDGYLNGLPINDLESGGVYWSNWGGLNDVMRQDAEVIGAEQSEWGYGGVAGTFNTDLRAASQWRQKRISYAVTNRNYRNRIMGTWSTGLLSSGWAFSLSGSHRWAQEGYIPGTFSDAWSYFASVGKKINDHHSINLVALGAPYQRGGNSTATQEMYDLANDHYYNSFWGYQQGKKRNGRIYSGHIPIFIFSHDWNPNDKLSITTSLGYQKGKNSLEGLDWLNANDPRPDYYRRLPSYISDPVVSGQIRDLLSNNEALRQIQWDQLYQVNLNNRFTVENVDGIAGNNVTGALSNYVMEERHSDLDKKSGNLVIQYLLGENSHILFGANVSIQNTHNFKVLSDLLGGDFYVDWDKFAEQDFPGNDAAKQNDLLRPNRILHVGDQFGYDYYSRIRQESAWLAYGVNANKWEISVAGAVKNHVYWRDGKTQVGKFPDNSLGESEKNQFFLPSGKGLIRYKFDGRNYLTVSGMVSEMAPTFRNAYVSPRTRDNTVAGLEKEQVQLGEIRYDLRAPYLKFSLAGFYLTTKNGTESTSFYHDDENTFVNFTLTDIDKKNTGIEAAFEYKIIPELAFQGAAAVGQYIYTSRPKATITQDNDGSVLQQNITIYAKNLYVSGTPQTSYTAGLVYSDKHFMKVYLNVNRFEDNWINFNPVRRTSLAVDLVEAGSPQWEAILQQEKVDPAWTVDLSVNKSWSLNWPEDRTTFTLNLSVTNLLNNTDYINSGYEQYRFDFETKDVNRFPSKYSYMQGLNFFVQGSLRF